MAGIVVVPRVHGVGGGGAVRRPGLRLHRGEVGAQVGDRHGRGDRDRGVIAVPCGGQQRRLAAGPFGAVQQRAGGFLAAHPVVGRSPAVVHDQQHGTLAGEHGAGVQHRACEGHDHQAGGQQAKGQQPPGGVGRGFLGGVQAEQEADGGEDFRARGGRA